MLPRHQTAPGLRLRNGNIIGLRQLLQGNLCPAVTHTAAANKNGLFGLLDRSHCPLQLALCHRAAIQVPHPLLQKVHRIVVGLAFHILWHGQTNGAGIRRICQHPHGI